MPHPREIDDKRIQLLVEGKDQEGFFEAICEKSFKRDKFQIQNFGGIDQLKPFLGTFVKSPNFVNVRSIGIVRDAEKNVESARQSVESGLSGANLPTNTRRGGWAREKDPYIDIFILPNNQDSGMLETLLNDSISNHDVNTCIDGYLKCAKGISTVSLDRPEKARVQAYLAIQEYPLVSIGTAAKKRLLGLAIGDFRGNPKIS